MTIKVIGLTGLAGCGKSTAASYLARYHGYERLRLSGPLKDMLRAIGLTDRHIEGDLKDVPCDLLCGKTPRYAMQTLGTEWRDMIGVRLWSNIWLDRARSTPYAVVAEDVRFPHEVEGVKAVDGLVVNIIRPDQAIVTSGHASEAFAATLPHDVTLINDGGITDLYRRVDLLLRGEVAEAA